MPSVWGLLASATENMHGGQIASVYLILSLLITVMQCNFPRESAKPEKNAMPPSNAPEPLDSAAIVGMIDNLSNTDIRWDGTFVGLAPTVVSDSARQLLSSGAVVIPHLVKALEDDTKFVAAHVLLTLVAGVEHPTVPWNGLEVDLLPDGQVKVDAAQRFELARRWQKWQQSTPHPRALPE